MFTKIQGYNGSDYDKFDNLTKYFNVVNYNIFIFSH